MRENVVTEFAHSTCLQIDRLENMLDNSTAIRRPKLEASANGAQKSIEREAYVSTMEHGSSRSRDVTDLDPDHLTLWQHPITTLYYFFSEVFLSMLNVARKTSLYKRTVCTVISIVILFLLSGRISGPQQEVCSHHVRNRSCRFDRHSDTT
jgi:hypothetical protein